MTIEKIMMGCKLDPYKFTVIELIHTKNHTIIMANYPGCKCFNGNKVMLLRGIHDKFEALDPHFIDEDYDVIARFVPTKIGMELALNSAHYLEL